MNMNPETNKEAMPTGEQIKNVPELKVPEVAAPAETPSNAPVQPADATVPPVKDDINLATPVKEEEPQTEEDLEATETNEIDSKWVGAVDEVIKRDQGKPYEEQEDAHKLSLKYLLKRFAKKIKEK